MTAEPLLSKATEASVDAVLSNPPHALLISGPKGAGKSFVASYIANQLLDIPYDRLDQYPYLRQLKPIDQKAMGIEVVRDIEHFMALTVPSNTIINRIVMIEDAQYLSREAQNALLKTLEEPPVRTMLILTTDDEASLLDTLRSRAAVMHLGPFAQDDCKQWFLARDYKENDIAQAYRLSGGLIGLMQALLSDTDHPLRNAVDLARTILQSTSHERLLLVDSLTTQKALTIDMCGMLEQMAQVSLMNEHTKDPARWQKILAISYETKKSLMESVQPKLALTNLMLNLG